MVPSLLSDSGLQKTARLVSLLVGGGLGMALLPLAAQAQVGRSFSFGQPAFRTQMGSPINQGVYAGPRMMPGNLSRPGGSPMISHYGMGYHTLNPGVIYRHGPPPGQNFGLFGGPPVRQNFGLFGPNTPVQEPSRTFVNPNGYETPRPPADRPGVSFYAGAPPGGSVRGTFHYLPPRIINPGVHINGFYVQYGNGVYGRAHYHHYSGFYGSIFAGGMAYYPCYSLDYLPGATCLSPYAYYLGAFPAYISAGNVDYAPPDEAYVPTPLYTPEGAYQGYQPENPDNNGLTQAPSSQGGYRISEETQANTEKPDDEVKAAVDDIMNAWKDRDIQSLVKHVRKDSQIAVYLRGKYQYSLDSGDYVDMTRDAFSATKTVRFVLDNIQRKQDGVYVVTGHHVYKDNSGAEHTVHISYVLERADDGYYITQVGTDPDKAVTLPGDEDKAPKLPAAQGNAAQPDNAQQGDVQPDDGATVP